MRGVLFIAFILFVPLVGAMVSHDAAQIRGGVFGSDFGVEDYAFTGLLNVSSVSWDGVVVSSVSSDALLGALLSSNDTLPTQWAVKAYVDAQIASSTI